MSSCILLCTCPLFPVSPLVSGRVLVVYLLIFYLILHLVVYLLLYLVVYLLLSLVVYLLLLCMDKYLTGLGYSLLIYPLIVLAYFLSQQKKRFCLSSLRPHTLEAEGRIR